LVHEDNPYSHFGHRGGRGGEKKGTTAAFRRAGYIGVNVSGSNQGYSGKEEVKVGGKFRLRGMGRRKPSEKRKMAQKDGLQCALHGFLVTGKERKKKEGLGESRRGC